MDSAFEQAGGVRVGIVGVGNCASSFIQGLSYYRAARDNNAPVPGLMHGDVGGYRVGDIAITAAFDVNASKVGRDVGKAILAPPNNTQVFAAVPELANTKSPDGGHLASEDVPRVTAVVARELQRLLSL